MKKPAPSQIAALIGSAQPFASLSAKQAEDLAGRSRYVVLRKGEAFVWRGRAARNVGVIVEGRVRASLIGPNGNELLVATGEAGDVVGLHALLQGGRPSTDVVADQRCAIIALPTEAVIELMEQNGAVSLAVARVVTTWISQLVLNLETIGLHKARTRLWSRLLQLGERYGTRDPASNALRIDHGFTQQDLADSISLTRTVVNRQLVGWRDLGLIEIGRGFVVVLDEKALNELVWSESG